MELLKRTIPLHEQEDIGGIVRAVAALKEVVVVNISDSERGKPLLFCEANLRDLLTRSSDVLFVEALPLGEFKKLTRKKIGQVSQAAVSLRAALGTCYAVDVASGVRQFALLADELVLMLECYGLQNVASGTGNKGAELREYLSTLASSCFEHLDNVRCMDSLQYEILPALNTLLKIFRK